MNLNVNISKLDLSNQDLDKIPVEVFALKNLRKLNLRNNKIKTLPKDIDKLNLLENLDLSYNRITSIYSNTCNLKKLNTLILNNNQIKTLPYQISQLKKLRKLSLSGNKLKSLPKEFINLENLESLNIANNEFSSFPREILQLLNLKKLWLNNNFFKEFPSKEIINHLPLLESFYCFGIYKNLNEEINNDYLLLSKNKGNSINLLKKITRKAPEKNVIPKKNIMNKFVKNKIFVSYSRKDNDWLEKVEAFLKTMQYEGIDLDVWSDKRIKTGEKWKDEIEKALNNASIAILIISTNFLASDFVQNNELPQILENAESKGTRILPLIVSHCRFTSNKKLSKFQSLNDPKIPLNKLNACDQDEMLLKLTDEIDLYLK